MYSFADLHHVLFQLIYALPCTKTNYHGDSVLQNDYLVHSSVKVTFNLQETQSSNAEVKSK